MTQLHIGIDDTDSKVGMCTTYIGAVAIERLKKIGARLVGFPKLIRLNPSCPHKTRGNCSVALTIEAQKDKIPQVTSVVLDTVQELAELRAENTDPGVVFYQGKQIPAILKSFSKKVVRDIVTIEEAEALAEKIGAKVHKFKLGRGIIGALAAVGNTLERDRTFEFIAYRVPKNWGTPRKVDAASVSKMDAKTYPKTFDNLDPSTGEIRITPHTPCPILYGIRGETPKAVENAHKLVKALELIERAIIYVTNQGTDEHLRRVKISNAKPYGSVIVDGTVCQTPRVIMGGHVIFRVRDMTGEIDCAAYEPTRQFREVVKKLIVGDKVRVYGSVKEKPELPRTINLEKLAVLKLAPAVRKDNPKCSRCGGRMKSEGRKKGYSCKKCKTWASPSSAKIVKLKRGVVLRKFEVPPRARRHLTKPLVREIRVKFSKHEV